MDSFFDDLKSSESKVKVKTLKDLSRDSEKRFDKKQSEKKEFKKKTKFVNLKPYTKMRLQNGAMYHLGKFSCTESTLRSTLKRRIDNWKYQSKKNNIDEDFINKKYSESLVYLEEVIEYCLKNSFLNDENYAASKERSNTLSGKSKYVIGQKLKQKGISADIIEKTLEDTDDEKSVIIFASKKRIGPFGEKVNPKKDIEKFLRAGFKYSLVQKVMKMERIEAESLL